MTQLVHHKAALDGSSHPPNSLAAVRACLAAGAEWIEVDISALAVDDFLLVHTPDLSAETTGRGNVSRTRPAETRDLRLRQHGVVSGEPPALLSEVVTAFVAAPGPARLQLDWKDHVPYVSSEPVERLARLLAPLERRVLVSSVADWQLQRLAEAAPGIELGFDIQLYLDYDPPGSVPDPDTFPRRTGAYGYRDDHPLTGGRWGSAADYLAERCREICRQVPAASTYYLRHSLVARSLADGFDWVQALHRQGKQVDAWTLDADTPGALANARLLAARGCDLITSNTPLALASLLKETNR
ncbi:MAG: glycerophosphodiester phosphodiesterase [Anaerolineae bacterium]